MSFHIIPKKYDVRIIGINVKIRNYLIFPVPTRFAMTDWLLFRPDEASAGKPFIGVRARTRFAAAVIGMPVKTDGTNLAVRTSGIFSAILKRR